MRRGLLALVVVVGGAACGRGTPPPTGTDDPGDSTPPPQPQVIAGSLTIHTRFGETETEAKSVYVLLGDGSRFFKQPDASGDVTFEDPSLVGPQNVTLVANFESGFSQAYTYLALERPEVWLPRVEPKVPPAQNPQRAFISGKVTGMHDVHNVYVYAVGRDARGSGYVTADGSYRIQVEGSLPSVMSLFAVERDPSHPSDFKAVGLKKDIPVPGWQQVSGQDVALDHPVDRQLQLNIDGTQTYPQHSGSARLSFYQDGQYLFDTSRDAFASYPSRFPASVPAIARTAPFDTTRAMLSVSVGAAYELPSGSAFARVPVEDFSSATLSLPKPMALTSPTALGAWSDPAPVVSNRGLVFQWSGGAAAQRVEFSMSPDFDNVEKFGWTVMAPGSVTSFTPFRLRIGETSFPRPFRGTYRITLRATFDGAIGHYADLFTQKPASDPLAPAWSTSLEGNLAFQ
ncbi:hypothetical protein JRI60_09010 [Archangium violaceum]|uniref:hypothetical protein n=1 Tax=Archangium violaceum TaxID=83451 RepID=UPI00195276C3|nr:hypothetical protein [Archangium violaceum]QRN99137.1 hypothetical protein JRI60_09010 [Archangium violaceum]